MTNIDQKHLIRKKMRALRQSFDVETFKSASISISQKITELDFYSPLSTVAAYLANDGELSIEPLLKQHKGLIAVPYLMPLKEGEMWFIQFSSHSELKRNRYGIAEPVWNPSKLVAVSDFDIVFFPLVAFDSQGGRLGMGGGFYDRCFSRLSKKANRPKFIGIAFDEQLSENLPIDPWDIRLDGVVTPRLFHCFSNCLA